MEYRRQVQLSGTRRDIDTDDERHSIFDFPPNFTPTDRLGRSARSGRNRTSLQSIASSQGKSRDKHPYPSSISIQKSAISSEKRSPTASPSERDFRRGEPRQENSPYRPKTANRESKCEVASEMEEHHSAGQTFFLRNRLSEAVDAYSQAIRAGLDELKHRNEMVSRLGGRNEGTKSNDAIILELGEAIANVHHDMGLALEVCAKYSDAKEEYSNGAGLLQNTCGKHNSDDALRREFKNISRMESGMAVEHERVELMEDLDAVMRKIENSTTASGKESARLDAMGCIKRMLRMEREAMGEQCYAVAKLKLKLAKLKCESGDLDNGLDDAESAIKTLKTILGSRHALVGASCSFAASAYEKRVSNLSGKATTCSKSIEGLGADGKVMINRALELYADTLEPMQFKHNDDSSIVRPDVGEVFHKIGRLYAKKGIYKSALDAYQRSLECFGAPHQGFHTDTAIVWHDMGEMFLASREYQNAIDACKKSNETARKVKSSSKDQKYVDKMKTLVVLNLQIAGDAYTSFGCYDEAIRSYQDALVELKRIQPNSHSLRCFSMGPLEESKLLKRIGMSLLKQDNDEDAKVSLIDALRVMRQDRANERSLDMPLLMADIGALHLKVHDYNAAVAVLRPCLKLYADQGVSDYSSEVQKAKDMFRKAQQRSSGRLDESEKDLSVFYPSESTQTRLITAPRMQVTPDTITSTNPGSNQSTMSPRQLEMTFTPDHLSSNERVKELHSQLEQAELKIAKLIESHKTEVSQQSESHKLEIEKLKETHAAAMREKELTFSSELDTARNEVASLKTNQKNMNKLRDAHASDVRNEEVKSLSTQLDQKITELARVKEIQSRDSVLLQELEKKFKKTQQKLKEVEADRDVEKKEMKSEIETLKKELSVSESSYQQILSAIDEEKELLSKSHDAKLRDIMTENSKLRENETKNQEILKEVAKLKEQNKKITQENGLLKYDNRQHRSEQETLAKEVLKLKEEINQKSVEHSNEAAVAEKLRKAELELESEKRRRAILEASLDQQYDQRQVPMGYPMFGFPPMNMPMNYGGSDKMEKKAKLLEIDLAAERENKEILEKTVADLTTEKKELQDQRESLVNTHEREMNKVFLELKKKDDDIAELTEIASQFRSVTDELTETKELLDEKNKLLDAFEQEHTVLVEVKGELESAQMNLEQKIVEYDDLLDQHQRMKNLHNQVATHYESEIEQSKKAAIELAKDLESKVAQVTRLEEELMAAKLAHREETTALSEEIARLQAVTDEELTGAKLELKSALNELQDANIHKEAFEQETKRLKQLAEEQNRELLKLVAKNEALESDTTGLKTLSEKSEEVCNQAKEKIKFLTMENADLEIEMDRLQGKISDIQQENAMYEEQFADLERVLDQMDSKLVSAEAALREKEIAFKLAEEKIVTIERDMELREKDAELVYEKFTELEASFKMTLSVVIRKFEAFLPDADSANESLDSLEEMKIRITTLATVISSQIKEKDQHIEEVNFEMSNALRELDTLESKYKQVREDLAASMNACKNEQELEQDYDELMRYCADLENNVAENRDLGEKIHGLQQERQSQEEQISGLKEAIEQHVEALKTVEEQRDMFQSRLKEAIDDLEELEHERNDIRQDLETNRSESTQLESSLRVKIECLEEENERLSEIEKQVLERDAIIFDNENKINELQKEIEIANNALEILRPASVPSRENRNKPRAHSLDEHEIYPDLLPSDVDVCNELASLRSVIKALESQNMKLSEKLADLQGGAPKMHDAQIQTLESSMDIPPPPPLPLQNAEVQTIASSSDFDDVVSLKQRLSELIERNDQLTKHIDQLKQDAQSNEAKDSAEWSREKEDLLKEIGSLSDKVQHLQEINEDLSSKIIRSQAEFDEATDRDSKMLGSLHSEVDDLKQQNKMLRDDLSKLPSRSHDEMVVDGGLNGEREDMLREITSLRDHIQTLEEYNEELSSQLIALQEALESIRMQERDAVAEEIKDMQSQIEVLESTNESLVAKLNDRSSDSSQAENSHQLEIASLKRALEEKNTHNHDDCKKALDSQKQQYEDELNNLKSQLLGLKSQETGDDIHDGCKKTLADQEMKHQSEIDGLKSQLCQLQEYNDANQEDISLLQIDLQNALNDCDENEIRHQQELSTVNMEFTNALNSLENLQKENKRLKLDIQSLSDLSKASLHGEQSDDNAYFEREITAAHSRFVSMEKSLQDRIERLEGEKYKLLTAHKDEMEKKDSAFDTVRVELSAWKLEMQNALNDIEGLKREKNELEHQVQVYKASLDALTRANEEGQMDNFVGN